MVWLFFSLFLIFVVRINTCGKARQQCFDTLVERYTSDWIPVLPQLKAQNPAYFNFCFCLMKVKSFNEIITSTQNATSTNTSKWVSFLNLSEANVNVKSEPNRNCNNSLIVVTLTVFFTAIFLVGVGELLLPRMFSIVTLLVIAGGFYAATLGSLYVAANSCPGPTYLQQVDTVRNLIIACACMLVIASVYNGFVLFQRRHPQPQRCCRSIIDYEDENKDKKKRSNNQLSIPLNPTASAASLIP